MSKFTMLIIILGLISCHQTKNEVKTKTLDFGLFTIGAPPSWTKIKLQGVDGYVGRIAIDDNDTLDFELGPFANNLHEDDPIVYDSNFIKDLDTNNVSFHSIILVRNSRFVDIDKYKKNNISWDTINGHQAKIVYPIRSGVGTTGVYIDSLWTFRSNIQRFNLYGENLKPSNEKKVLQVLKTLMFYNK